MENEQTNFIPLAEDVFLSLGAQHIAYVKAINLPDGAHAIGGGGRLDARGKMEADGKGHGFADLPAPHSESGRPLRYRASTPRRRRRRR